MPLGLLKQNQEVKTAILEELTRDAPLAAKEAYRRVLKRLDRKVTYQAIHKALKELQREGVLSGEGKKYALNPLWVNRIKSFAERAEKKASKKPALDFGEIQNDTSQTLVFESYMEALYALLENMDKDRQIDKTPEIALVHQYHTWPVTAISDKQFEELRRVMAVGEQYSLVNQNTKLDKDIAEFWRRLGAKVKLGIPCATNCDLLITRNLVVQIFLAPGVRKGLHDVFKKSEKNKFDIGEFYNAIFGLKGKVTIVITQNGELANQIREETLKYFPKNKNQKIKATKSVLKPYE